MRSADIVQFSLIPILYQYIQNGQLLLVKWDMLPDHTFLPYYDQRIVYNHANLAFTGLNVYLAMIDLDEYIMTMRAVLKNFKEIARECASDSAVKV